MQIESALTLFDSRNPSAVRIFRACKGLTIPLITGTRPSARFLCHRMGAETCIAHAAGILDGDGASSRLLCAARATELPASISRRPSDRRRSRNPRKRGRRLAHRDARQETEAGPAASVLAARDTELAGSPRTTISWPRFGLGEPCASSPKRGHLVARSVVPAGPPGSRSFTLAGRLGRTTKDPVRLPYGARPGGRARARPASRRAQPSSTSAPMMMQPLTMSW